MRYIFAFRETLGTRLHPLYTEDRRDALDTCVRNFPLILFHVGRRGAVASEEGQNVS